MGARYWKSCEEANLPRVRMMDTSVGSKSNYIEAQRGYKSITKKAFRYDHPKDIVI